MNIKTDIEFENNNYYQVTYYIDDSGNKILFEKILIGFKN